MNELSLFSGAGGGLLATKHLLGFRTIGYVEWDDYCQRVLAQRIRENNLDEAPIFGDIRTFIDQGYAEQYKGMVDVITGGFPCQPFSTASRGRKTSRDMWPYMFKAIGIVNPSLVFAENVCKKSIEQAAKDLRTLGFKTTAISLSAGDVGADHIRRRYWLLAYADNKSELLLKINAKMAFVPSLQKNIWESGPGDRGVSNGPTNRMDRFKAIGNGQVPIVAATAFRILSDGII